MIYLDNAATTFPKPASVKTAVNNALAKFGANPGRSGYKMSIETSDKIFSCRKKLCDFFDTDSVENVIFTANCTQSVNIVLKGFLKSGDHVVISSLEHNCVLRPLNKLKEKGISYSVATIYPADNDKTVDSFRKSINAHTKLVICMHASNVWGIRLPIERISALAHSYNIKIMVDVAQSAGVLPISIKKYGIDFLCIAGHKGLYGPMGTGVLITEHSDKLDTLVEGGTGTNSISGEQPNFPPDKFESGTLNVPGIIGLSSGVHFVKKIGIENIFKHETMLCEYLYNGLSSIKRVKLYTEFDKKYFVPVLSFNIENMHSEELVEKLGYMGFALRGGLHCAPLAHTMMNTQATGSARVSFSYFNKLRDVKMLLNAINKIANEHN